MLSPFQNEPLPGFSGPGEKNGKDQKDQTKRAEAYRLALAEVRRRLGSHKPLIIGGRKVDTGERIASLNPAKPAELIGTVAVAGPAQIDAAFAAAWGAFPEWAACPAAERAAATVRLAAELRRRKLELAAWETLEASKNWSEAEADVAEAIDFCEYYARQVLEWLVGGSAVDLDGGYYIEPTIFAEVPADSRLGQHEIFGPVLSAIRARDFDEAVALFNQTEYGLTGGLFSRSRKRIERAKREFYVGNLYINREITGARVGVQPFGGFKMSGSNAKAGGPDYVRLFMEMKTVAERI